MRALVMLPTYNEIENIQDVLERTRRALPDADVLVIDDGSPDGTAETAEKLGAGMVGDLAGTDAPRCCAARRSPVWAPPTAPASASASPGGTT